MSRNVNVPIRLRALISGLVLISLMAGCSSSAQENKVEQATTNGLTTDQWKQLSVTTAKLEPIRNELGLTGTVSVNQDQVVRVFPLVSGHLSAVKAALGDYVRKGEVLAVMYSGDMADLGQQYTSARSQVAVAQKNLQVTQDMVKSGLSSQRDLVVTQEALSAAQAELNRVTERQRILGAKSSTSEYAIKAPVSGFVVEKNAAAGMELRTDDAESLFTISNLDKVWVLADVYESDISKVQLGSTATVTTLAYPDQPMTGHVDKVFNVLDPESRTEKVRIILPNNSYKLKPQMFANVTISYPGQGKEVAVPAESLVFDNSRNYVVVVAPGKQLQVREVTVDRTVGDRAYISSGLNAGESVVSHNQLLAYSAMHN